jgi:hypothetical protein
MSAVALIGAFCAAALLHSADSRQSGAYIALIAWPWGLAVTVLASRARAPSLAYALLLGGLCRLVLVGTPPLLSDDLYRYLWEGLALSAGANPVAVAPAALAALDPALAAQVNHPELASIYPPLALAWFRVLHAVGGTPVAAQAMTMLADLTVIAALHRLTRARGCWPALLYATHPLPIFESASSAHLEIVAIALAAWALALPRRFAPLLTVLAAGAKVLPALWLPAVLSRRRGGAAGAVAGALVLLALAGPTLSAGEDALTSWRAYGQSWSFNGLAWSLTSWWLGDLARPALIAAGAIAVVAVWRHARAPLPMWLGCATAFLFLSPTVHPWYALWALVPALALGQRGWAIAATSLLGSYAVLWSFDPSTGAWSEPPWLVFATWGPALAALAGDAWSRRARAARARSASTTDEPPTSR